MTRDQLRAIVRLLIYGILFAILVAWRFPFAVLERNAEINDCQTFAGDPLPPPCPTPGPNDGGL